MLVFLAIPELETQGHFSHIRAWNWDLKAVELEWPGLESSRGDERKNGFASRAATQQLLKVT